MVKKIILMSSIAAIIAGGLVYETTVKTTATASDKHVKSQKVSNEPTARESRLTIKPTVSQAVQPQQEDAAQPETTQKTEVSNAQTTSAPQATPSQTTTTQSAPQAPASSAGLFRFHGLSFALRDFGAGGSAQVPTSPYVYRWTQSSTPWYLVEQSGSAGAYIQSVQLGDKVEIDGHTYTVTDVARHLASNAGTSGINSAAWAYYDAHRSQHAAGFQTCDNNDYETLWFLD